MSRSAPYRELAAVGAVLGVVGCQFGAGVGLCSELAALEAVSGVVAPFSELAVVGAVLGVVGCQFGGQSVGRRPTVSVVAA